MTDDKAVLAIYEEAARIYCKKCEIDPDEMVPVPVRTIMGAPDKLVPQWHFAARELHDFSLKVTSLREAGGQKPPAKH